MPVIRRIPDNKRRSRTGCIPCRRRRRKCDERRPQCGSCQSRHVTCEFKEWTFVSGVRSSLRRDDTIQNDDADESEMAMPVQDSLLSFPESSPPPPDPPLEISITGVEQTVRVESARNIPHNVPQLVGTATSHHQQNEGNQIPTPSRWNETVLSEQSSSERQTAMLRFRYQIAPWLEANAPRSSFGSKIMILAAEKTVIMDIIVWVAMRRSRGSGHPTDQDGDSHFVQQIQHRLSLEGVVAVQVGRSLLALGDFFYTCPSDWASFHGSSHLDLDDRYQFFTDQEEPLKTLSRFHFKIELASSIIATKTPAFQPPPPTNDTFVISAMSSSEIHDTSLAHLAACCRLLHDELIPLFNDLPTTQSPNHESYSLAWATWSKLWARCVQWFRDRPPDMVPLLESPEVDTHATTMGNSPFAADIYSSAVSVQTNMIIHFSSLLLLSYKPRLVKLSSVPHRLVSRSWHAQKIAKLAVWNNFSEQWDPVAVAIVLRIARDMTYASQHEALLSCLQRVGDMIKTPLQSEIADLQRFWRSSRHTSAPNHSYS